MVDVEVQITNSFLQELEQERLFAKAMVEARPKMAPTKTKEPPFKQPPVAKAPIQQQTAEETADAEAEALLVEQQRLAMQAQLLADAERHAMCEQEELAQLQDELFAKEEAKAEPEKASSSSGMAEPVEVKEEYYEHWVNENGYKCWIVGDVWWFEDEHTPGLYWKWSPARSWQRWREPDSRQQCWFFCSAQHPRNQTETEKPV